LGFFGTPPLGTGWGAVNHGPHSFNVGGLTRQQDDKNYEGDKSFVDHGLSPPLRIMPLGTGHDRHPIGLPAKGDKNTFSLCQKPTP
jgi:hypothetical protein